ncbi:MAG: hypothetical protein ACRDJJ_04190 [Actinomycetota bacterium]
MEKGARVIALAVAAGAAVIGLGLAYGFLRAAIAVVMFAAIAVVGIRYLYSVLQAPPEPEVSDVSEYGLRYVCRMCGLELRVERAARDRPPTHCMEPMELVTESGKPPLRPL